MPKTIQPIIIKKGRKAAHAHHGGAWKIAYADFVTAMMAFFLLMWLISMTTQEQKIGLAEYFSPGAVSPATNGAGGMLFGTSLDTTGNKASKPKSAALGSAEQKVTARPTNSVRASDLDSNPAADVQADHSAIATLRQALEKLPDIAELSRNIVIEPTKEGINVSLVDEDGRPMFREGSFDPYERTRRVLDALAPALRRLPNLLTITGHTSAARPGSAPAVEPWKLTAGRALAVREVLAVAGVPNDNFASVGGRADAEPVFPDNPYMAANRRVTITLLNTGPPAPPKFLR